MTNHTPGPWNSVVVDTIGGDPALWHIRDLTRGVVAAVESVNEADARLIAAAPDLLAFARLIVEGEGNSIRELMEAGRAAIAKATA
jgi:hypothetical protein